MLQLKKFPDIPVSTREEARESRPHPEETRFRLLPREEGSFTCLVGKEFPAFPSHLKRRRSPSRGERNSRVVPPFPESPRCLSPFQGNQFSLHGLDVEAEDPLTPRWHVGQPCGKASWESLVGKPQGKATDPLIHGKGSATLLLQFGKKAHVNAPNSRRGLTPLGRIQKYSKIHVSTGEESSGSGTDSTQGLRPRHRRESSPERPSCNSHGHWPFLRPPERVPEVPVVSQAHLPQLEKIQEVLPSRRDEAHFR